MDNIEVGEYVRTKDGRIYQANNSNAEWILSDIFYKVIVKHSKNIIDLIELGDYVNGAKVIKIDCDCYAITNEKSAYSINKSYTDYQIKSIVTKQQFKEMEYRVDE